MSLETFLYVCLEEIKLLSMLLPSSCSCLRRYNSNFLPTSY